MTRTLAKSVRMKVETWEHLRWVAETEGIRVNDFVRDAVTQALERYPRPPALDPEQLTIEDGTSA